MSKPIIPVLGARAAVPLWSCVAPRRGSTSVTAGTDRVFPVQAAWRGCDRRERSPGVAEDGCDSPVPAPRLRGDLTRNEGTDRWGACVSSGGSAGDAGPGPKGRPRRDGRRCRRQVEMPAPGGDAGAGRRIRYGAEDHDRPDVLRPAPRPPPGARRPAAGDRSAVVAIAGWCHARGLDRAIRACERRTSLHATRSDADRAAPEPPDERPTPGLEPGPGPLSASAAPSPQSTSRR